MRIPHHSFLLSLLSANDSDISLFQFNSLLSFHFNIITILYQIKKRKNFNWKANVSATFLAFLPKKSHVNNGCTFQEHKKLDMINMLIEAPILVQILEFGTKIPI